MVGVPGPIAGTTPTGGARRSAAPPHDRSERPRPQPAAAGVTTARVREVGAAAGLDVREAGLHGAGVPGAGTPGTPGAPGAGERGDGAGRPGYRVEATWSQGERP